jgi:class 3 adenylate cyclase
MSDHPSNAWLTTEDGRRIEAIGRCAFGRAGSNTVVIDSSRASRQHAAVFLQAGGYWLVDFGSRNGTLLNDRQVVKPVRLRDGDRIVLAEMTYVFHQQASFLNAEEALLLATEPRLVRETRWLLVADIQDFTPRSQQVSPEELARTVNGWLSSCSEAIEAHGGEVSNYTGDGFLANWRDLPATASTVAATILELQRKARGDELVFRTVVHYGKVGLGGIGTALGQSLIGSEVNYAFRLDKGASSLGLHFLFSAAAAAKLAGLLPLVAAPRGLEFKGFEGPQTVFHLADEQPRPEA